MKKIRNLHLIKPTCEREGCPLEGQQHPRCRAHNRKGKPCGIAPLAGQLVCKMHGGKTPGAEEAGQTRQAIAQAMTLASRIVAYDGDDPETPEEGLLREVRWSGQVAKALGLACESLQDRDLIGRGVGGGEQLAVLMQAWANERVVHAKMCKLAIDAGIDQRRIDLAESQAGMVVAAMMSMLTSPRLGLSADQITEGKIVAAQVLRELGSGSDAAPTINA